MSTQRRDIPFDSHFTLSAFALKPLVQAAALARVAGSAAHDGGRTPVQAEPRPAGGADEDVAR